MRRVILILLTFIATTAAGQVQLSFDVGGSYKTYSHTEGGLTAMDGSLPAGGEGHLTLRAGYGCGPAFSAGLLLGGGYSSYRYTDGCYNPDNNKWEEMSNTLRRGLTLTGGLYLRFTLLHKGPWAVYAELTARYDRLDGVESRSENTTSSLYTVDMSRRRLQQDLAAQLAPLLSYTLGRHWTADLRLDWVALTILHSRTNTTPWHQGSADNPNAASETITTQYGLGAHLLPHSGISLGFSYQF